MTNIRYKHAFTKIVNIMPKECANHVISYLVEPNLLQLVSIQIKSVMQRTSASIAIKSNISKIKKTKF